MVGAIILISLYLLPTIVAICRQHQNIGSILVINLFLGWTVLGWVAALAMSASAVNVPMSIRIEPRIAAPLDQPMSRYEIEPQSRPVPPSPNRKVVMGAAVAGVLVASGVAVMGAYEYGRQAAMANAKPPTIGVWKTSVTPIRQTMR